jgi:hypothetical protein
MYSTAASASSVWVIGEPTPHEGSAVERWNGKSWQETPLPKISLPASDFLVPDGIAADSATSVWATESIVDEATSAEQTVLLHWNGRSWSRVSVPTAAEYWMIN